MRIPGAALRRPEDALVRSIALPPRAICGLGGVPRSEAVSLAGRHTNGSQPGACVGCLTGGLDGLVEPAPLAVAFGASVDGSGDLHGVSHRRALLRILRAHPRLRPALPVGRTRGAGSVSLPCGRPRRAWWASSRGVGGSQDAASARDGRGGLRPRAGVPLRGGVEGIDVVCLARIPTRLGAVTRRRLRPRRRLACTGKRDVSGERARSHAGAPPCR